MSYIDTPCVGLYCLKAITAGRHEPPFAWLHFNKAKTLEAVTAEWACRTKIETKRA